MNTLTDIYASQFFVQGKLLVYLDCEYVHEQFNGHIWWCIEVNENCVYSCRVP